MRYILLASVTFVVGYVLGILFGYRSAVVDYVENDAATIQEMADSMYDNVSNMNEIPDELQDVINEAENTDSEAKGFQ